MTKAPVLLLGYNRPEQMTGLIKSLEPHKPELILLAVDGPKQNRINDLELVKQTQEAINQVTWNAEIITRFRESNLGLRRAVVDAVTWANSEYGRVIVLEDDVRVGPQLLDYLNFNLNKYEKQSKIAHINGYNLVPNDYLTNPGGTSRLSVYPESYAWATWNWAWKKYDDDLKWAKSASISDIKRVCGSTLGALRWKQNFADAANERIDTWAYRWLATIWEQNWAIVSPNKNLSSYHGHIDGTHTRMATRVAELSVEPLAFDQHDPITDYKADEFISSTVMGETVLKLMRGVVISSVLGVNKYRRLHLRE